MRTSPLSRPTQDRSGEVRSTCPYCGVGCGVILSQTRDGWAVGGDPDHPANKGRLCSKGANLMDTLSDDGRLLVPSVDGAETSWSQALDAVADRLKQTLDEHGPEAVAFYVSGQLLTEDYYVANKLLKGFVGSQHIDTNSRLCMASTVVGHKRAFGADAVPGSYEDFEQADLVVLVGSNLAWCHPVLAQRLRQARRDRGTRVVVIDPRKTATCDDADMHLPLAAGSDVTLFNGLLSHLAATNALDQDYIRAHVDGFDAALAAAQAEAPDVATTARLCDLPTKDVALFFHWFARTERTVTVFSQGVNQSSQGTDKVNAIINCHFATGRVGKPGSTPFSVTGQPNAMGGREVGGLANQLAAHMNPNDPVDVERLRRFWKAPALRQGEGKKAVDLFRAIEDGSIKFLWVMATNPAVSLPEANRIQKALATCPTVVVSDVVARNDTLRYAHIALPAAAWGEKDGTVTNSERRISRQRPFRDLRGQAQPDWWIMSEVGKRLGFAAAFNYTSAADIFREHAALSGFENNGLRAFDIGGVAKISDKAYDALTPFQWPLSHPKSTGTSRLYADGLFTHSNRRGKMLAVTGAAPKEARSPFLPLVLNTGRYRDQWHTMTRTGISPKLAAHRPEPLLDIHPQDAATYGLEQGQLARISNHNGDVLCRVNLSEGQRVGDVFLPIHWTDTLSSRAITSRLVSGHVDPYSGQPESKHVPVRVAPFAAQWSGLLFHSLSGPQEARLRQQLETVPYWCQQTGSHQSLLLELAGDDEAQYVSLMDGLFAEDSLEPKGQVERLVYRDDARNVVRVAWMEGDRLRACLFIARQRPALARSWLQELFAYPTLTASQRAVLLAGQAPAGSRQESGRVVCSCFSVGVLTIESALRDGRATTVEEIGRLLKAGTGCGSCVSELKEIVRHVHPSSPPSAA